MKYAIDIPNFEPFHDPNAIKDLAFEADYSGWDGFCPRWITKNGAVHPSPHQLIQIIDYVKSQQTSPKDIDVTVGGSTFNNLKSQQSLIGSYKKAGPTRWFERLDKSPTIKHALNIVKNGPPFSLI